MTFSNPIRQQGEALLRLADALDACAPGLFPNPEITAPASVHFYAPSLPMFLSYEAVVRQTGLYGPPSCRSLGDHPFIFYPSPLPLSITAGSPVYPNPAAPSDPNSALIPSYDHLPEGFHRIPYSYTVIERTTPSDVN